MQYSFKELRTDEFGDFSRQDFIEILEVCVESIPESLEQLRVGMAASDSEAVIGSLHNLKSNTSYICKGNLPDGFSEVEQTIKTNGLKGSESDVARLLERGELLLDEISRFLSE